MDFDDLRSKIEQAASEAFLAVRRKFPSQIFCGYALYSDPDAVTVAPAVNRLVTCKDGRATTRGTPSITGGVLASGITSSDRCGVLQGYLHPFEQ
ncbi:DUF4303 domain-containing protein [Cupriavidus basilensis]